jgi:midasin
MAAATSMDLIPCGKEACAHLVEVLSKIRSPQEKSKDFDYVIKTFPNILIDIVNLVIKQATDNAREFSRHSQAADANIQQLKPFFVLGWLLGKSPQISNLIYNYFETSSFQPLPEESFQYTSTKQTEITYTYPGFDDELVKNILVTYFKYLSFNPKWFSSVWNWSELGRFISMHPNQAINYLALCCLSTITRPTRHQHMMSLQDIIKEPSQLIDLQLKHANIFRHKSRPLVETRPERAAEFIKVVGGKSETGQYELCTESITKVSNALLPKRDISLESNHLKKTIEKAISRFVPVQSLCDALSRIAYAASINKPCLIRGPTGSGKTSILDYIAAHTNRARPPDYIKVQVGDQIDSKSLIGSYVCTEIPGQFEWQAGPLTQALAYGSWIVFEDIDSAPPEMAQVIHSVIENGNLSCVSCCPIKMDPHPDFKIFFTQRTKNFTDRESLKLGFGFIERLCDIVDIPELSDSDLKEILNKRYQFGHLNDTILQLFHSAQESMAKANMVRASRLLTLTDLFKFCDRIAKKEMKANDGRYASSDIDGLLMDSIDCFIASLPSEHRIEPARILGQILNKPVVDTDAILSRRPEIRDDGRSHSVGRATLDSCKNNEKKDFTAPSTLAHTRQSLQLMESVSLCINNREPVLLVGETGVGKTTIVQHLSNLMNTELTVINLSQQSDSSDLLGGVRPVEMREIIKPIHEEFVELFDQIYDRKQNEEFLRRAEGLYLTSKKSSEWLIYLVVLGTLCNQSMKRQSPKEVLDRWAKLSVRVRRLRKRLSETDSSPMALAFAEGTLLQAVRKGKWILLDEVNLAEPDMLQCLLLILDSLKDSHLFIQCGNEKEGPIFINPKFRIFACMNPSTDIGKRDLPLGIRERFTEFFVDDVDEFHDLRLIVESYGKTCLKPHHIEGIVQFYREVRFRSHALTDVSGNNPIYSLRSLCRALTICAQNVCKNIEKSLLESFKITFLQQLSDISTKQVLSLIQEFIFKNTSVSQLSELDIPMPQDNHKYLEVEKFWIQISSQKLHQDENYILTKTVRGNLRRISRILCLGQRKLPILIQGQTSVGKTSLIKYLARLSGNMCYRINNHEHTDLQEYTGKYVLRETGELQWQDGLLTKAMRKGYWVILDELNLAPCELLEALNRVLDDNRELFIPETRERFNAHAKFVLFATQNPPEEYAGRKMLSRAFRNRFVELHFDELPHDELEEILHKRCRMPPRYAKKIVTVMKELQMFRRESVCFGGKNSFMTMRDLFRWGNRYLVFKDTVRDDDFFDWDFFMASQGLILLEGRVRTVNEADIVKSTIEKVFSKKLDRDVIYESEHTKTFLNDERFKHIHFTPEFKRLYVQLSEALKYKEPVLLCGQTGCGKTTACQLYASQTGSKLIVYNCHANTESSDFVGNVRPARDSSKNRFPWQDGPLVQAMQSGSIFLLDEISLADDAVLERINSVLEPGRSLTLTEKDGEEIIAKDTFRVVATMNPGGDYGKKELSTALRNRFTEIYCHNTTNVKQIMAIVEKSLSPDLLRIKAAPSLLKVMNNFLAKYYQDQDIISIRDILSWTSFLNATTKLGRESTLSIQDAIINGASLVFFDQFGTCGHKALHFDASLARQTELMEKLRKLVDSKIGQNPVYQDKLTTGFQKSEEFVKFGKFSIRKGPQPTSDQNDFIFNTPTVQANTEKLVRALQLDRPILLEGDPGAGKTSIVTALARLTGHKLIRINLSDQTDLSDLFGSDLPDPHDDGNEEPRFCWHDGPLLRAIRESSWVLLDEMNLASQSVLEGLNACFDHRGEIYISELDKTIMVDRSTTRIFACQNPYNQGSARKGLPLSFVNRFTSIYVASHTDEDLLIILNQLHPKVPKDIIEKMINFNGLVSEDHRMQGYEFNLRDLIYWCDLMTRYVDGDDFKNLDLYEPERFVQFVYIDRMRSLVDRAEVNDTFEKVFGYPIYEPPYRDIKLGEYSFLIARASLPRKIRLPPQLEDLCILKYQMPYLESITKALEFSRMPILVGEPGVGKRSMVKILAAITGNQLNVIGANRDMDTVELLGSYEQKSLQREMVDLVDQATAFALSLINGLPKLSRTDSLKRLFKHVWSTLYSISIREHRLSKNELMEAYRFQLTLLETLIEKLQPLSVNDTDVRCKQFQNMISVLKKRVLFNSESTYSSGDFEWVDSLLIKSIKEGSWLLIENANLMNPATLDRLNSLVEPDGTLTLNEKGSGPGGIETIKAHPDFRLILTMNPEHGELSRAMRNRGVEIYVRTRFYYEDFLMLLNQAGFPIVPETACMTYCIMQTSYDTHVKFTEEMPEDDGALLAHFGLNCSVILSNQIRRGVAIDNILAELFTAFYRQRGYLTEFDDESISQFIQAKMMEYREKYVVSTKDERYKWMNFRHDLRALTGGDAIPAMLHKERKVLEEWECPLSIGLLKFDEMIENADIVFCCTAIKIFMELSSPSDFEYRKNCVEYQYSMSPEPFFKRMLELVGSEIGQLQQECLPMIAKELPNTGPIQAVDMFVDTRNSPDLHYTLLSLNYSDTTSREDLQNRWILSLYRINLTMITDQIEKISLEGQETTSLWALSEKVRTNQMLQDDLIRPQAMIATDLYDFLNGLIRYVSNRCFSNNLVVKLMGRLFWISYFSCKLKRGFKKEELIAACNQIPMLWALTYQKVVKPLIEDCELADVPFNGKKFSSRIKHICDFLDVNTTPPSKIEKEYYHKVVNRYAATTKRCESISRETDKFFNMLIGRYTIKSQAMDFVSDKSATLAASNLVWSNSVYMLSIYKAVDLLVEVDVVDDDSPDGIQSIGEKLATASNILVTRRTDYEVHENNLATELSYRERCLNVHKRRCALDQFSPVWQTRFIHSRLSKVIQPHTETKILKHIQSSTRRMLRDVNGILMSPRYYSTMNKFIAIKLLDSPKSDPNISADDKDTSTQVSHAKKDFNMYSVFLVDHMLENIVLDNQLVGWIKMRVTTSDLSSSAPIIPEYSPVISLVSSYCLDLSHLKLNSYNKSSPQLESMLAYLWRAYAQIKSGHHGVIYDLKMAQNLLHLRMELDDNEKLIGPHKCVTKVGNCGCLDAYARLRTAKYDENMKIVQERADTGDKTLFVKAFRLIHFGFYHMLEYAPIFSLDPALRSREKSEVYKAELAHTKIDLHLRNTLHYWKTGENLRLVDVTPEESKLYPFSVRVLIARRAKLEQSIKKLRQEFTNRPRSDDGTLYYELRKEVEIAVVRNTERITELINDLLNYLKLNKPAPRVQKLHHLNTRCRMFIKNLEKSIARFKSDFILYSDLTTHYIVGLCFILHGVRLLYSRIEQKVQLNDMNFKHCLVDKFSKNVMRLFSFSDFKSNGMELVNHKRMLYPLLPVICPEDSVSHAQSLLLRSILLQLNHHIIITPSDIKLCIPIVRNVADRFHKAWLERKKYIEEQRKKQEDLYQYKAPSTTVGYQTSLERQEFLDIANKFPVYDHIYHDNPESLPQNELVNFDTEAKILNLNRNVHLGMCIDVCKAHYKFMKEASLSLLGNRNSNDEVLKFRDVDINQLIKLEAELFYKVIRKCISNLDAKFDSLSLECHVLQANELIKTLRQSEPEKLQTGSLRSSIEILDEEIFDIYYNACPYETLKFQELLAQIDNRVNVIQSNKSFEKHPLLAGITRLTARIGSFLITDPLMKFVTGGHALLQHLEDWNKMTPRELKMIQEADNLINLIHSWRSMELKSWRSSLHRVKRKYIDDTLCDLWFRLHEAFNDPLGSTKRFLIDKGYDADDVMDMPVDEYFYQGFVWLIKDFFEGATLGDYQIRLDLVFSFAIQTRFASLYEQSKSSIVRFQHLQNKTEKLVDQEHNVDYEKLTTYVHNIYRQYEGLMDSYKEILSQEEAALSTELNNEIRVVNWQGRNLWEIKNNFRISHRKLNKVMNKYLGVLRRPIPSISPSTRLLGKELEISSMNNSKTFENIFERTHNLIVQYERQLNFEYSSRLCSLKGIASIIAKIVEFEKATHESTKARYFNVLASFEDTIESNSGSIKTFGTQRAQDLVIHERDSKEIKAEKLKTCRQIYHSKKFSLQSIFKNLQNIGASYRRGLNNSERLDGSILSLEPLRGMIQNQSIAVLKAAAALVDDPLVITCNELYRDVVTKNQSLLSQQRRDDLSGDQIERIQGYSFDMILDIIMHKKNAALIYKHLMDIQASAYRLEQLRGMSGDKIVVYNFSRFHNSVKRFNELTSRTYISLSKLDTIMDCYETYSSIQRLESSTKSTDDLRERRALNDMINEVHNSCSLLTEDQHKHIQRNMPEVRKRLARVSSKLKDKLKCTIRNYLYSDDDVQDIQQLFQCFIDALDLLQSPNCNEKINNARPGTIFGSIRSLRVEADQDLRQMLSREYFAGKSEEIDVDSHSNFDKLDIRLKKLLRQVKLVAQGLYTEEKKFSESEPTSEAEKRNAKPFNHIDSGKFRDLLRSAQVAKQLSNSFITLNLEDRSTNVKPIVLKLAPLLSIYTQDLSRYLNIILHTMHLKLISANQLISFFTDVVVNGFGLPCKIDELEGGAESGPTKQSEEDNVGFGEGQGKNDASKKLEFESQLDETKTEENDAKQDEDDTSANEHIDAHDDGVEMTEDFDAKAEGPESNSDQEGEENNDEADDDRLDELDKDLDTVDQDEGQLDKNLWGDEDEPLPEDDEGDLREADLDQSIKPEMDEKDLMGKNADLKEIKKETNDQQQVDENKADEDGKDADVNDDKAISDADTPDIDDKIDVDGDSVPPDPTNENGDEEANEDGQESDLGDEDPLPDFIDHDDGDDDNINDDHEELDMDLSDVSADGSALSDSGADDQKQQGVNADDNNADQLLGDDIEMFGSPTADMNESDANKESEFASGKNPNDGGRDGDSSDLDAQPNDDDLSGKRTLADRSSIEPDQQIKRQRIEDAAAGKEEKDDSKQRDGEEERMRHLEKDTTTAVEVIDILSDSDDDYVFDGSTEISDQQQQRSGKLMDPKGDQGGDEGDESQGDNENDDKLNQQQQQSTYNTNLGLLKYISHGVTDKEQSVDGESAANNSTDLMKEIDEILGHASKDSEHESIETDRLTTLWLECTKNNAHLVHELCQQLQIVLQPTKMSKYKGDYKTGKRLNMRKIISYIASQYRKDKIWLRRTKPCKRTYNISLAVDNSSSMSENNCRQMTYQSLALMAKSLSIIEAGSLNVISFGESVKSIHDFDQPYVDAIGAQWLRELRFNETKTSYTKMLKYSYESFAKQARQSSGSQEIRTSVNQLLIIISDGRNVTSEEEDVKHQLRLLKSIGVLALFVIIDDLKQNDGKSIMDVKSCVKFGGQFRVEDYMDRFPFPFYVLLRQIETMPSVLGDALRQWFELVSNAS